MPKPLASLRALRGARFEAFNAYRESLDPNGLEVQRVTQYYPAPPVASTLPEAECGPLDKTAKKMGGTERGRG